MVEADVGLREGGQPGLLPLAEGLVGLAVGMLTGSARKGRRMQDPTLSVEQVCVSDKGFKAIYFAKKKKKRRGYSPCDIYLQYLTAWQLEHHISLSTSVPTRLQHVGR